MSDARPAGEHDQTPLDHRSAIPDDRSSHGILGRTWELELLISGAVVFALVQLPAVFEREFDRIEPHLSGGLRDAAFLGFLYASGILYTLIFSFILHLTARAFWVGLIGLDSVYPHGIRWEKATPQYGPISLRVYRQLIPSLRTLIVRADRFCSVIFSFAFLIISFFLASILLLGMLNMIAYVLSTALFGGERQGEVFWIVLGVFFVLMVSISIVDKNWGEKLDPAGWPARAVETVIRRFVYPFLLGPVYGTISLMLITNVKKRTIYPLMAFGFLGVLTFFLIHQLVKQGVVSLSSYEYLPDQAGELEMSPAYYEDQRPENKILRLTPSVQSDVIRGPYIKLFIPYFSERYDPLVEERCPEIKAGRDAAKRPPQALLGCLSKILKVSLDGRPLPGLELYFHTHPKSGLRGLLGYIPTAGLSRGSHLLRVEGVPKPRSDKTESHAIRLWL